MYQALKSGALNTGVDGFQVAPPHLEGDLESQLGGEGGEIGAAVQGLTLLHFSAQPEPFLALKTSPQRLNTPSSPAINTP